MAQHLFQQVLSICVSIPNFRALFKPPGNNLPTPPATSPPYVHDVLKIKQHPIPAIEPNVRNLLLQHAIDERISLIQF